MEQRRCIRIRAVYIALLAVFATAFADIAGAVDGAGAEYPVVVETVSFDSADGATRLVGYLFRPEGVGPFPALVLMHGRAGVHAAGRAANPSADSLSARHRHWARTWAAQGYLALLVDGFGPRGHAGGFPRGSYRDRPAAVDEQTVRPRDADGAAVWLRTRPDVDAGRIGLFGWSNGAMATLARVTRGVGDGGASATPFRAAVALYPGCAVPERTRARPQLPLLLVIAGADDEVSPERCIRWATDVASGVAGFEWQVHPGARHNFDGRALGSGASIADREAAAATEAAAFAFIARHLVAAPAR